MALNLDCSTQDYLIRTLKNLFGANILHTPREISPLDVIECNNKFDRPKYRGKLSSLISSDALFDITEQDFELRRIADVEGKKSRSINFDQGFDILSGFLSGYGISSPNLKMQLAGSKEVSFSFKNVTNILISNGLLGQKIKAIKIDKTNAANNNFFSDIDASEFTVVDSVITSNEFLIHFNKSSEENFNLDFKKIENFINDLNLGVKAKNLGETSIAFQGIKHLTFAFGCIQFILNDEGKVVGMPPYQKRISGNFFSSKEKFENKMIEPDYDLIDLDF